MKTDMSPQAITMRIRKTSELRKLCVALGGARMKRKLIKMAKNLHFETTAPDPLLQNDR